MYYLGYGLSACLFHHLSAVLTGEWVGLSSLSGGLDNVNQGICFW